MSEPATIGFRAAATPEAQAGLAALKARYDHVPPDRRAAYLAHLLCHVVAPGGRLIIGVHNEERDRDTVAAEVSGYGHRIAGRASRPHRHPGIAYKVIWIDA